MKLNWERWRGQSLAYLGSLEIGGCSMLQARGVMNRYGQREPDDMRQQKC